jgi:mono/diheme cytochrome c family protein
MTLLHSFTKQGSGSTRRPAAARLGGGIALAAAALMALSGCAETGQMNSQPRLNPLSSSALWADGSSARPLVAGSVPYAAADSAAPDSPALTGVDEQGNPLQGLPVDATSDLVQRGQERYEIYCRVCHGPTGEGNGQVVTFGFPKPPSLLSDDAKALTDGEIFAVIRDGRGKMFSYGYRVKAEDRWAVIAYLRAMQLKNGKVDVSQLSEDELKQIGSQP